MGAVRAKPRATKEAGQREGGARRGSNAQGSGERLVEFIALSARRVDAASLSWQGIQYYTRSAYKQRMQQHAQGTPTLLLYTRPTLLHQAHLVRRARERTDERVDNDQAAARPQQRVQAGEEARARLRVFRRTGWLVACEAVTVVTGSMNRAWQMACSGCYPGRVAAGTRARMYA